MHTQYEDPTENLPIRLLYNGHPHYDCIRLKTDPNFPQQQLILLNSRPINLEKKLNIMAISYKAFFADSTSFDFPYVIRILH